MLNNLKQQFMKTKFRNLFLTAVVIYGALMLMSLRIIQAPAAWVAPKYADTITNPLKNNAASIDEGKKTYVKLCVVCHGEKGKGDGLGAAALNPKPADHTSDKVQSQSDGAIFWKLTKGKAPMASYEKTLTATQRWQVVNYMRTLKKAKK
jgi:mono/diheme cytochrome c family protein